MTKTHRLQLPNGLIVEFAPTPDGEVTIIAHCPADKCAEGRGWRSGGAISQEAALAIYVELGKFLGRFADE